MFNFIVEHYQELMIQLSDYIEVKRYSSGSEMMQMILLHDNARSHTAKATMSARVEKFYFRSHEEVRKVFRNFLGQNRYISPEVEFENYLRFSKNV